MLPKSNGGWGIKQPFWFNLALSLKNGWRVLNGTSLWHKILFVKYMKGIPLDLWIRFEYFKFQGGSIFWRSLCRHFHWIRGGLCWLVGDGKLMHTGLDQYVGVQEGSYLLPLPLVRRIQLMGCGRLYQIVNKEIGALSYWKRSCDLGLVGEDARYWDLYLTGLARSGIRLCNRKDQLIWSLFKNGDITAKGLYSYFISVMEPRPSLWWHKRLWKWECPLKIKTFWWLVLNRAILTWDNLKKRGYIGPGICVLCWTHDESIDHLFIFCEFTKLIWSMLGPELDLRHVWGHLDLHSSFEQWVFKHSLNPIISIIVYWALWRHRNSIIFEDSKPSASEIFRWIVHLFSLYPIQQAKHKKVRDHAPTLLSRHIAVGTFDGAAQGELSGGGGTISLVDGKIYHFKVGLGKGTNNRAELLSLWSLLWIARTLHISELEILGDSKLIIDWVNGKNSLRQVALLHWFHKITSIKGDFEHLSFHHHYREYNTLADTLSKEALHLSEGVLLLKEIGDIVSSTWEHFTIY